MADYGPIIESLIEFQRNLILSAIKERALTSIQNIQVLAETWDQGRHTLAAIREALRRAEMDVSDREYRLCQALEAGGHTREKAIPDGSRALYAEDGGVVEVKLLELKPID